jgi:hypothetical protein
MARAPESLCAAREKKFKEGLKISFDTLFSFDIVIDLILLIGAVEVCP